MMYNLSACITHNRDGLKLNTKVNDSLQVVLNISHLRTKFYEMYFEKQSKSR